jgi:hypothetical protein
MNTIKKFVKRYYIHLLVTVAGSIAGYLYWYYIGCNSGTCPITSKWQNSMLYGLVLGYLSGDMLHGMIKKNKKKEKNEIHGNHKQS